MRKITTKSILASLVASLVIVAGAHAAATGNVLTLEAEQDADSGEISFSGTTDQGVFAVSCILSNASGEEVFFGSAPVDSAAFDGTFTMPVDNYILKCANYDGGDWISATIGEITEEEDDTETPETGHVTNTEGGSASSDNSAIWISVGVGAVLVVAAGTVLWLKRKKNA